VLFEENNQLIETRVKEIGFVPSGGILDQQGLAALRKNGQLV